MDLDYLHARISAFLTEELSADWTLLKDVSRYSITIVKTAFLFHFPSDLNDCKEVTSDENATLNGICPAVLIRSLKTEPEDVSISEDDRLRSDAVVRRKSGPEKIINVTMRSAEEDAIDELVEIHSSADKKLFPLPVVVIERLEESFVGGEKRVRSKRFSEDDIAHYNNDAKERGVQKTNDEVVTMNGGGAHLFDNEAVTTDNVMRTRKSRISCDVNNSRLDYDNDNDVIDDDDDVADHDFELSNEDKTHRGSALESVENRNALAKAWSNQGRKRAAFQLPKDEGELEKLKILAIKNIEKVRKKKKTKTPSKLYARIPGTNSFICRANDCYAVFGTQGGAYHHYMRDHKGIDQKMHPCHLCTRSFRSNAALAWHIDFRHPETIPADSPFICELCGKVLSCSSTLTSHINRLHRNKKINYFRFCRVCHVPIEELKGKESGVAGGGSEEIETSKNSVSLRAALLEHFLSRHPEEIITCSYVETDGCPKKFVQRSLMTRHVATAHENRMSWMSCPHCEKKYPSAKKLNFHVDAQHSETRDQLDFFCVWPGCARGFSSEDNLKHHVKGHYSRAKKKVNGSVPRKECKTCGKAVAPTYMAEHVRQVHGPRNPVKCDQCDSVSPSPRALKDHIRIWHTGIIYTCAACCKTFNFKRALNDHIQHIHEKRPVKCTACERTYSKRKEMLVHFKAVHEGKKHACRICQREFSRGPDRNRHERNCHKVDNWDGRVTVP